MQPAAIRLLREKLQVEANAELVLAQTRIAQLERELAKERLHHNNTKERLRHVHTWGPVPPVGRVRSR